MATPMTRSGRDLVAVLAALAMTTSVTGPAAADRPRRRPPAPPPAAAEPSPAPTPEASAGPWADGVTDAQKAAAQQTLEAGNAQFLDKKFAEALVLYREALAAWDHPAIRFNVVRCLISLGRPLEASENLELALRYGAAPLEDAVYQEAIGYQTLLAGQIGTLEVRCAEPGAQVSLDGQALVTCPGTATRRLLVGRHQVLARKKDYLTVTHDLDIAAGATEAFALTMVSLADSARTERRWTAWKPWALFGSGAAIAGLGGLLQLKAASDMDAYDAAVKDACPTGCPPGMLSSGDAGLKDSARLENNLAVGLMIGGGVVAIGGLVAVYLNRPRTILPDTEAGVGGRQALVRPIVGPNQIGVSLAF